MPLTKGFAISIVALILGLLMAFQFRTHQLPPTVISPDRAQALTQELKELDKELNALSAEASDLEAKLLNAQKGVEEARAALNNEITKNKMLAGLVPVKGPGVELILRYAPQDNRSTHLFTLRDEDLLRVVNELRAASAEAIAINDQRVVDTTEIRLAGSYINVNLTRIVPPYRIVAIGNPEELRKMLEMPDGVVPTFQSWGIDVQLKTVDEIEIPAYQGNLEKRFAWPATKGGGA
ncbi:MAG: DUF881 domain-containing protein [Bacillota bacterium]